MYTFVFYVFIESFPSPLQAFGLSQALGSRCGIFEFARRLFKPSGQGQEPETQRLKTGRFNDDLSSLTLNLPSNSIYSRTVG